MDHHHPAQIARLAERANDRPHLVRADGQAQRTLVLAVLRGALLDLLATGDVERTTAAVHQQVTALRSR